MIWAVSGVGLFTLLLTREAWPSSNVWLRTSGLFCAGYLMGRIGVYVVLHV